MERTILGPVDILDWEGRAICRGRVGGAHGFALLKLVTARRGISGRVGLHGLFIDELGSGGDGIE